MRHVRLILTTGLLLCLGFAALAQADSLTADEVFDRTRSTWQGDSFHATLSLDIVLSGQTKSYVLEVWTLGDEAALLRIHEPEEDAGSGYLEVDGKLYYYSALLGSPIELPAIALAEALFGSGPSLEDLSHGTLSEDYESELEILDAATDDDPAYRLILIPHADAPVVYGELRILVSAQFVIQEIVYYDQRGNVLQTATFRDVVDIDGNLLPTTIEIVDTHGDRTIERILDPEFAPELDASFFTIETLVGGGEP